MQNFKQCFVHHFLAFATNRRTCWTVAAFTAVFTTISVSESLGAQATTGAASALTPAVSAVILRVRTTADAGDGDKARTVLDSLVAALPRESTDAAEALYWRASLSEQSPSAERDWKQLIVEVPQSPRVPDALLRLAELDIMHNNSLLARQHAKRLITDYPDAPQRVRALVVLAQSYFTDNDAPRACGVLTVVRREAPLSAVEVRMQADEMQQQCRNVREVAMGASPDATPLATVAPVGPLIPPVILPAPVATTTRDAAAATRDSIAARRTVDARNEKMIRDSLAARKAADARDARNAAAARKAADASALALRNAELARKAKEARDSADAREAAAARQAEIANEAAAARVAAARAAALAEKNAHTTPSVPATGRWTIQVAAYDTRAQADALVKKLIANDLPAHTVGAKKPFRVQVGRFVTREEAANALTGMKTKGQNGFISEWAKR